MIYSLVKTSTDERGDQRLVREAAWLRELEHVDDLEGQVPRVLDEGTTREGRRFLVVSLAAGEGETRAFTDDHARFLAKLGRARFKVADFEVSGCFEALQRQLRATPDPLLEEACADCEAALLYWTGPYVLSQGDFAPWNIRTLGSQLFVYEWGEARSEASPLDDVLHYLMIQRALRHRPLNTGYLTASMKHAHEFAVRAYPEWTWRPPVIGALTLAYLIGAVLHDSPAREAYRRLIRKRAAWMPHLLKGETFA
ncbi:MAG TPA: hypothetical protein VD965_10765 [Burkholderiales bacterium]|nr:hypothetical protein [Burkholderiales bacterium]